MSAVGYAVTTEGAVALVAATVKTVLGVKAHANSGLQLKAFTLAFDGVTASAVPVLIELCYATFATNSPDTNSTSVTPRQKYGRALTAGFTAAKNWTAEPTALTPIKEWFISAYMGTWEKEYPLGTEPDTALAEGLVLRLTAPAVVNVRATMDCERI